MPPSSKVSEVRTKLREIVAELQGSVRRLRAVATEMPRPADQDDMLDGLVASDAATEIACTAELAVLEMIQPAIDYLERSSRVTDEELRRRFEKQKR